MSWSSLCIMLLKKKAIYDLSIISAIYYSFSNVYLTIFVRLRHGHDINQAAMTVVFILPCNSTYKNAAASCFAIPLE